MDFDDRVTQHVWSIYSGRAHFGDKLITNRDLLLYVFAFNLVTLEVIQFGGRNPGYRYLMCIPSLLVQIARPPVRPLVFVLFRIDCQLLRPDSVLLDGVSRTGRGDFRHE